jgi:hypothetical protein
MSGAAYAKCPLCSKYQRCYYSIIQLVGFRKFEFYCDSCMTYTTLKQKLAALPVIDKDKS